ncbi:hypothetical protein DM01DRAFT_1322817 [Hesseltinella vesiculosa]|uniref:Uncharacterized protein n=1 Tax=Hesseltinella vesiculosa TaxID=101127 RepID=A0A1X2GG86_9FUNG|nr:hypothetical protein DM01DRAFT_1322817 [Hesseltinella vesiculosa]
MGCCNSSEAMVHEVVFDDHGIATRVPKGQGTHLIHEYSDQETNVEKKQAPVMPKTSGFYAEVVEPKQPQAAYLPTPPPSVGSMKRKKVTLTRPSSISKRVHPAKWTDHVSPQSTPIAAA